MIYKRMAANLRAQNWLAIGIELGIVIVGVFIGTWVANWNEGRAESAETAHRLDQLRPELDRIASRADLVRQYYVTSRRYAETAFAGWAKDPKVDDNDFVIAAYQASQIKAMSTTSQSWADLFGSDQLRNIDDPAIRDPMLRLMTYPSENIGLTRVQSKCRDDVRSVISDGIQQRIRAKCGDYFATPDALDFSLPNECPLELDPEEATATAAELRRHPELVANLRLHLALVASLLNDVRIYDTAARRLREELRR
ncbi:MAG: hypothetical protein LH465_09955 [Sphingomonas bacterium]|nr:hypothetical protein [Sphingomonas bacterium]